jgi:hypothetical protein
MNCVSACEPTEEGAAIAAWFSSSPSNVIDFWKNIFRLFSRPVKLLRFSPHFREL